MLPHLQSNQYVQSHGFKSNHFGRLVVRLSETFYVITRQHLRTHCKKTKDNIEEEMRVWCGGAEKGNVKYKYTFMGWDKKSFPLLEHGLGDEFPAAFLTWEAGVEKPVLDLMWPLFDKKVKADTLSSILLELHLKEHTRWHLRNEREIARRTSFI